MRTDKSCFTVRFSHARALAADCYAFLSIRDISAKIWIWDVLKLSYHLSTRRYEHRVISWGFVDLYHINENVTGDESTSNSAELPGSRPGRRDRSRSREQRLRDAITLANFERIHPNAILVPLSRANRELRDALFDLFSHEKLPRDLRRIVSDQRAARREWSGIKILELIFNEIDTYKTINVLVENKFHAVQFTGCGKASELLSTKKKLFERLLKETQRMLNTGKPLEEEIQKTFMLSGREFSSKEKIQYQGLSASVLALILASP